LVVNEEANENESTPLLWSERTSLVKKGLTEPALLEMSGNQTNHEQRFASTLPHAVRCRYDELCRFPWQKGAFPHWDGIRGLAISMVLVWHAVFGTFGAQPRPTYFGRLTPLATALARLGMATWSGVDLFFVLSGFLIGGILLDAVGSQSNFRTFYIRRAHRILPLYAAVLVIAFIVDHHYRGLPRPDWASSELSFFYYVTFLQNFWMAAHGGRAPSCSR
jgi:peptidoglycan/LPS O-acetylase OafA/YrhL